MSVATKYAEYSKGGVVPQCRIDLPGHFKILAGAVCDARDSINWGTHLAFAFDLVCRADGAGFMDAFS